MRRTLSVLACLLSLLFAAPALAVEPGVVQLGGFDSVDAPAETQAAGAHWVRMFVDWNKYEPAPGSYDAFEDRHFEERIAAATARGQKVLLVVLRSPKWASGSDDANHPPRNPASYAAFLRRMALRFPAVAAFEVWNEPDEPTFWSPAPDARAYAALLDASYGAVKSANPSALVVSGGLTGNNYRFLEQVIDAGARRFDAVGLHTDTACLTSAPDEQYREPDGRIGRYSFTGYREVRHSMLARGLDKPLWLTEMGWSTLTSTCTSGSRAGTKPSGVDPETQAKFLSQAYACLERDPYVSHAFWFSLQDIGGGGGYDHYLGLIDEHGRRKPSFGAFRSFATASPRPTERCGSDVDLTPPAVTIQSPTPELEYLEGVEVRATATDDQVVTGMELWVDGQKVNGRQAKPEYVLSYLKAKELSVGRHELVIKAFDAAQNVGQATTYIVKGDPNTFAVPPAVLAFAASRKRGRKMAVTTQVTAPGAAATPRGVVWVTLERRRTVKRGGRKVKVWSPSRRYGADPRVRVRRVLKLARGGRWRVSAVYTAKAPFKSSRSAYAKFRFR